MIFMHIFFLILILILFFDSESEKELFQQYLRNQALETPILVTLIIVYAVLIFIGAFGNGLVCLAVARNPRMRTSQNLFIVNLAISDLLLCFFTIPFSLFEIATKFWPYGMYIYNDDDDDRNDEDIFFCIKYFYSEI